MKRVLTFFTVFFAVLTAHAQQDSVFYVGIVKNQFTQAIMGDVKVSIYGSDTLVAQSTTDLDYSLNGDDGGLYTLSIPRDEAVYTIVFEKEGFETVRETFHSKRFRMTEKFRIKPTVYMMPLPKDKELHTVTVKATKIKFYHNGDTLVYNADMFNLPEGSMLDNLIKSMPGAEISDEGEITINGRKVDALMLNGEKFFKNNNEVMLRNLPSYMVKNLKAYEKTDKASKLPGATRKVEEYVLDVILKKEYSIGWIGNMEAGMGSNNRYLARLFGLRFTTASRIGVYANFNNLNDKRKPGEDSNWTPDNMPTGLLSQKMGGIDYLIKPKFTNTKLSGSAEISYTDADNYQETTQETYMLRNSMFTRSRQKSRSGNFAFNTAHQWEFKKADNISGLYLSPSLKYTRQDYRQSLLSATFDGNPSIYAKGAALFDSIQQMQGSNLRRMMLNRYDEQYKNNNHSLSSDLSAKYLTVFSGIYFEFNGGISYQTKKTDMFDLYDLSYPNNPQETSQYLYRYDRRKPDKTLEYKFNPHALIFIPKGRLDISLDVGRCIKDRTFSRYNLHTLEGWGAGSDHEFGELPSEIEYMKYALDNRNSYDLHEIGNYMGIDPTLYFEIERKNSTTTYALEFTTYRHHYHFDYTQGDVYSGVTSKAFVLFSPQLDFKHSWDKNKHRRSITFNYWANQTAPGMKTLLEVDDTTNPLATYSGNSHLKKSTTHYTNLIYSHANTEKETSFSVRAHYSITANAIAYPYVIDKATGHRHYTPQNVNGNYIAYVSTNYSGHVDKKRKLALTTSTYVQLTHGVDYISDDPDVAPRRNSADAWWGTEDLKLKYNIGKHSIGLKGRLGVTHASSSRADFSSYTLYDFNYGLTGLLKLPYGIEFSTDLTMYSRRGYATSSANTNDVVWNARLSKTFLKAGITLAVDGFDILNRLSNITQVVNSQGRTETYYNALPRYIMAHMIYRFNKKPKK